jgi:hypothetical protein
MSARNSSDLKNSACRFSTVPSASAFA